MRKLLTALLLTVLAVSVSASVTANSAEFSEWFDSGIPDGWQTSATPNYGSVTYEDGTVVLTNDTAGGAASSSAALTTNETKLEKQSVIHVRSRVNKSVSGVKRTIRLRDSNNNLYTLAEMDDLTLHVFGAEKTVAADVFFDLTMAIDLDQNTIVIWLDETEIYSGGADFMGKVNADAVMLVFTNSFVRKNTAAQWILDGVTLKKAGTYAFSSIPENHSQVQTTDEQGEVVVSFQTPIRPEIKRRVKFYCGEDEIEAEIFYGVDHIRLILAAGFEPRKEYRLALDPVTEIFGETEHTEQIDFKVADESYLAPMVALSASASVVYVGERLELTAVVTPGSEPVARVEFYLDDVKIGETDTAPYTLAWIPESVGNYRMTARAIDGADGYGDSPVQEIAVLQNLPPTIEVQGLADNGILSADTWFLVPVTAKDSDGTVSRLELYVDGRLYASTTESSYSFELEGLISGSHVLTVIAYDDRNARGELTLRLTAVKSLETYYKGGDFAGSGTWNRCENRREQ